MRGFHALKPDHLFVFHVRNDFPEIPKGNIGSEVKLAGSRAATVVVVVKSRILAYGIARCQWKFPFNRKLARKVATGRALQALGTSIKDPIHWENHGIAFGEVTSTMTEKDIYQISRKAAIRLIESLSSRAIMNGYNLHDEENMLDRAKSCE
jgi:hypothetical protein